MHQTQEKIRDIQTHYFQDRETPRCFGSAVLTCPRAEGTAEGSIGSAPSLGSVQNTRRQNRSAQLGIFTIADVKSGQQSEGRSGPACSQAVSQESKYVQRQLCKVKKQSQVLRRLQVLRENVLDWIEIKKFETHTSQLLDSSKKLGLAANSKKKCLAAQRKTSRRNA